MQDNALIQLIIATLIAGEAIAGIPGTPIAQAFQPTNQGVDTGPSAYIYKIGDRRYGFVKTEDYWDEILSKIIHREIQPYETTFQLSFLATQNPTTPDQLTASDFLNLCASILQSDNALAAFQAQGVGIERVTDVRNPYFSDDRQQFEASPSFDFVMTHTQIIASQTPVVLETIIQMKQI